MSKTPRTDQAAFEANFSGTVFKVVDAYFARQLETELVAAKAKLRELRRKKNDKKENEKFPVVRKNSRKVGESTKDSRSHTYRSYSACNRTVV